MSDKLLDRDKSGPPSMLTPAMLRLAQAQAEEFKALWEEAMREQDRLRGVIEEHGRRIEELKRCLDAAGKTTP
jgi:hypothetical protein